MKVHALLIVITAGLLIAADDDAVKKEKAKLKGTWEVVALEEEGKKAPLPADAKMKLTFGDAKLTMHFGDKADDKDAAYSIDPSKKPATLDLIPSEGPEKGKAVACIYTFDKDELKICGAAKPGLERPKEFATKEGSKTMMMVLKREKK